MVAAFCIWMVLELAFLLVPKGPSHLSDGLWQHVLSFLSAKDIACFAQCSVRMRQIAGAHKKAKPVVKQVRVSVSSSAVSPSSVSAADAAASVSSAASASASSGSGSVANLQKKTESAPMAAVEEQEPETKGGIFASLRGGGKKGSSSSGGFSLRKPKKKDK